MINASIQEMADFAGWDSVFKWVQKKSKHSIDPSLAKILIKNCMGDQQFQQFLADNDTALANAINWLRVSIDKQVEPENIDLLNRIIATGGDEVSFYYLARAGIYLKQKKTELAQKDLVCAANYANSDQGIDRCYSLLTKIEKESTNYFSRKIRIAVMGHKTTNFLARALKLACVRNNICLTTYTPAYASVDQEILTPDSEFYKFCPEYVLLLDFWRDINLSGWTANPESFIEENVIKIVNRWKILRSRYHGAIIQTLIDWPHMRQLGNLAGIDKGGAIEIVRQINSKILDRAPEYKITVFDSQYLTSLHGLDFSNDGAYWHGAQQHPSPTSLNSFAKGIAGLVSAVSGVSKKVLVLDLDNTLWGGVIGEDGLQGIKLGGPSAAGTAFLEFQQYILELKHRGIILAVCSKNNYEDAILPFEHHESMIIKKNDIAVFKANWNDKATNIREIVKTLNVGIDSVVFLDDNPVERGIVRQLLPEVVVPEMPLDPSNYIRALDAGSFFESVSLSTEDFERANNYVLNAKREELKASSSSVEDFLNNLKMRSVCSRFVDQDIVRITQLIGKTNQFNLTNFRHDENKVRNFSTAENCWTQSFRLSDVYGDHGLIGVMVAYSDSKRKNALYIDTWLMSCRVIGRQMEQFMFNALVNFAVANKYELIVGHYRPTAKNEMVSKLFLSFGFTEDLVNSTTTDQFFIFKIDHWKQIHTSIIQIAMTAN